MKNKVINQNIAVKILLLIISIILVFIANGCEKTKTVIIDNPNYNSYILQLQGSWISNDTSAQYAEVIFLRENSDNDGNNDYIIIKDNQGKETKEEITNIIANDDYMKTYSIEIDQENKYSFYMTDSNNIVFENVSLRLIDEYFDAAFTEIEGSWTNDSGIKVTFFTNKNNRYVNLTDGFGTFNKRIFDIEAAADKGVGNYIKTKEGTSFIDFYYNFTSDGKLDFYDYELYRNEDTTEYEDLKQEELPEPEEITEETKEPTYDLSTHGTSTGYEVADYSGDIPTDTAYIFVGDSRFVGMNTACGISSRSNQFVVAKISQGYFWLTNEAMPQVDKIISNHNAASWVVIFNLGINDLGNISKYKSFYQSLADKPYKVVMVSVNPVGNYPSIPNETVEGFNNSIKGLGYTYVDTYSYLMNERGYVTPDGLHYSNSTYQDIYRYIIYSVKGISISDADRQSIDNQYHGENVSDNGISENSVSDNSVSSNEAENQPKMTYENVEAFYANETNSVEFSSRIQNIKASCSEVFSNVTVTVNGNTITYNYIYGIDVPDVDWDSTDSQLDATAAAEIGKLRQDSGITSEITIGYIYYDKEGTEVHSYYSKQ